MEVGLIRNIPARSICEVLPKMYLKVTINRSLAPIVSRLREDFVIAGAIRLSKCSYFVGVTLKNLKKCS